MSQAMLFSSGFELAPFVISSGLLRRSWNVISSDHATINSNVGEGLLWKVHKESDTGLTIIAFEATPVSNYHLQADLVSSSALREENFFDFDFLCTTRNSLFSVNKTAVSLFCENHEKLDQLKSEIKGFTPLIVTGNAIGGSVASLFTLLLLDSIGPGKNCPLCITFGSPLIGDKNLRQAISRSSTWNSCFLHVVSHKDPLPRLFITNHSSQFVALSPQTSAYMPFGKFLFISDVNSTCFENPDSILELLVAMGLIHDQNQGFQSVDYGNMVKNLYRKAICKDFAARAQDINHFNSLHASICLQLWALGFTPNIQQEQQNIDINTLATKMEKLEKIFFVQNRTIFNPYRKLNIMKINMAPLEWYKKDSKNRCIGYYNSYKNMLLTTDQDVVKFQYNLTHYWKNIVEEAEMKPQKEGVAFRNHLLFAGTSYRRMVEPLAIADYYRDGGKDYVTKGRPKHFKELEKWLEEWLKEWPTTKLSDSNGNSKHNVESISAKDSSFWAYIDEALRSFKKDLDFTIGNEECLKEGTTTATSDSNKKSKHNVESILTRDSCFWAYVEEALLSCKVLKSGLRKEEARKKLLEFEEYVYGLLKNYAVSPDIFLKGSSYMHWWNEYKAIKGTSYDSILASFMSNAKNYEQYAVGAFDFS